MPVSDPTPVGAPGASAPATADATKPAAPAAAPVAAVKLPNRPAPTTAETDAAQQKVEKDLRAVVERFKTVAGTGMESSGEGDPRVNERRKAVASLLALRLNDQAFIDELAKISPQIDADIKWLVSAEFRDYSIDVRDQFQWVTNGMVQSDAVEREYRDRLMKGLTRSNDVLAGAVPYFDATDGSVVGIRFFARPPLRKAALLDTIWQFRAKPQAKKGADTRVDLIGPPLVAELRNLLGALSPDLNSIEGRAEYALLREIVASHPLSSANTIFQARNAVAVIMKDGDPHAYTSSTTRTAWVHLETPPGATLPPYKAVHHNFSAQTPRNIEALIKAWMYPVGPDAHRVKAFDALTEALTLARNGDLDTAKQVLADLAAAPAGVSISALMATPAVAGTDATALADAIRDFLVGGCVKDLGKNPETNLLMAATLYRAVCTGQPTVDNVGAAIRYAGNAAAEVAAVLVAMAGKDDVALLTEIATAREKLRLEYTKEPAGYRRHELLTVDATLNRLACETLGSVVDRLGALEDDAKLADAFEALYAAVKMAGVMGLDALGAKADGAPLYDLPFAKLYRDMSDAKALNRTVSLDQYRSLMAAAKKAIATVIHDIRDLYDGRAGQVAKNPNVELDPEFLDQLIKQTPLHYATAIAERGMRVGLKETLEPRLLANLDGMRVLNSVGPVVFSTAVFADSTAELRKLKAPRDALSVVYNLQEKKMVATGGLMVDTKDAPGGNSHLNMYAMNNGIPVIALPELRTRYAEFFKNAAAEGGIYVDDGDGQFRMMTVGYAIDKGLIAAADVAKLKPGVNRQIKFLKPSAVDGVWDVLATHDAMVSPQRPTRVVELYEPLADVKGVGGSCTSFAELARLGVAARHLAGEKGTVLALLKAELGDNVPDGSVVTTGRIVKLLADAGLADLWQGIWSNDPVVGVVDDQNFLHSAFYTDPDYREAKRAELQEQTRVRLSRLLVEKAPDGSERLSAAGLALYAELTSNKTLQTSDNWIARSSFTGEDRPGKSGAGQYESFPNLKDPVARVKGVIGVIESAWMPEPVDNNVADQIFLRHIMPAVVMQACLKPEVSGVAVSRGDGGARGQVRIQLKVGFGGGVDGGKVEEGVILASGYGVQIHYPGRTANLVPDDAMQALRDVVLKVERYFDDVVEKGKGHAVDMEVVLENGKWNVVQARVILLDQ
ncbi:MAG: hypothetical protein HY903_03485 [Deltaproteobacteria bacterium]|nr:hypothetical protein [Deltaproteobacteria bacterium]